MIEASKNWGEDARIKESKPRFETIVGAIEEKLKTVNNKLSVKKTSVVQRMKQLIFFQPPPSPKLANADFMMVRKIPIIQAPVVYAPLTELLKPPEPPDT